MKSKDTDSLNAGRPVIRPPSALDSHPALVVRHPILKDWVLGARYIDMPHPDEHGMRIVGVVVPKNELTLMPKAALEMALRPLLVPQHNGNDDHDAGEPRIREGG